MNLKKELLKTLKNIVGIYFDKVYAPNELHISQKEVGGKVELVSADGTLAPAPDGAYVMEDGFSFEVKDGQIASIVDGNDAAPTDQVKAASQPADDTGIDTEDAGVDKEDDQTDKEDDADDKALLQKITELEAKIDALTQAIADINAKPVAASKDEVNAFAKQFEELNANIKTLAKVPVEFSKTTTSNIVKDNKEQKLIELARMLAKK